MADQLPFYLVIFYMKDFIKILKQNRIFNFGSFCFYANKLFVIRVNLLNLSSYFTVFTMESSGYSLIEN